jgi:hypothetical protein
LCTETGSAEVSLLLVLGTRHLREAGCSEVISYRYSNAAVILAILGNLKPASASCIIIGDPQHRSAFTWAGQGRAGQG